MFVDLGWIPYAIKINVFRLFIAPSSSPYCRLEEEWDCVICGKATVTRIISIPPARASCYSIYHFCMLFP